MKGLRVTEIKIMKKKTEPKINKLKTDILK